jgi:hypothetical protein
VSEKLPYEEQLAQQWNDFPLSDENMAWADMKRRLEEDDDKPVVAWWRGGCGMWGLLLLLLLTIGWFIVRPEKWFSNSKKENTIAKEGTVSGNSKDKNGNTSENSTKDKNENNPSTNSSTDPNTVTTPIDTNAPENSNSTGNTTSSTTNTCTNNKSGDGNTVPVSNPTGNDRTNTNNPVTPRRSNPTNTNRSITNSNSSASQSTNLTGGNRSGGNRTRGQRGQTKPPATTKPNQQSPGNTPGQLPGNPVNDNTKDPVTVQPDSPAVAIPKVISPDTSIAKQKTPADPIAKKDSVVKKPVVVSVDKEKEKKKTYFSAGIAMHQLLPVAGQKSSPYNSLGRKGTLLDYIPSAYLRFHKENKWFIQAEFRYGAPQYIKDKDKDGLLYDQKIVTDTGQNPRYVHTTSTRLQKTYYHQLPLSFNYYVMPNWSVGAGVVWNKFKTAISESEINRHDNFLQRDSLFPKTSMKVAADTAMQFSKSYFQAMFETQYQWKRFSIGGRYAVGLDPYIRFTLPNQSPRQERNQSVQLFIRYQLWRSKSK